MTILPSPPAGWKRKGFTGKIKLQVILNQDGRSKISGDRLGRADNVHFDHRPPLALRQFDTEAWDTIPPENDLDHIEAITIEEHRIRTIGTKATTAGSDIHTIRKAQRIERNAKRPPPAVGLKPDHANKPKRTRRWRTRSKKGTRDA